MNVRIAIIGGGAAGLMCAATLLEESANLEIHLFEKNKQLGSKILLSGGGRCNVTTGITEKKMLLSAYTRGNLFLRTAIGQFPPEKVAEWFEQHDVPLKTEADQRVFPISDNGKDIVAVFEKMLDQKKALLHDNEPVLTIKPKNSTTCELTTKLKNYVFDTVVLCTGGNAYRHTGSTGDGYGFAEAFGHSITPLGPSLNSFICAERWPKTLSGLSLPNAKLQTKTTEGKKLCVQGPMIFTHFGISGPAVFALSSHLVFSDLSENNPITVSLIPIPGKTPQEWDELFRSEFQQRGAQTVSNLLRSYLPARLVPIVNKKAGLVSGKKSSETSKSERESLVRALTGGLTVSLTNRRAGDEFITAGGVTLSEVDPKTMQSKKHPSLYFGGELLDVDGVTGGFNLQAAWATGRLAGKSISKRLNH